MVGPLLDSRSMDQARLFGGDLAQVIVGLKPGRTEHAADNKRAFRFSLGPADLETIDEALRGVAPLPGDCGDE